MWNKAFFIDLAERVVATAAQAAVAIIGTYTLLSDIDWAIVLGTTGIAALTALLKGFVGLQTGDRRSAGIFVRR